jgi:hypothetical protein
MKAASQVHHPVTAHTARPCASAGTEDIGTFEATPDRGPGVTFRKPFANLQAKLVVGKSGDALERTADSIAARVVDGDRQSAPESADESPAAELRRGISPASMAALGGGRRASLLGLPLERARSNGRPLPEFVRAPMERAFGTSLDGVAIHTDVAADRLSAALGAVAFTTGRDIFFRRGAFAPEQAHGRELIAHELAHVVQQSASPVLGSSGAARCYTQRRLTVKATNDDPAALGDAAAIVAAFTDRRQALVQKFGPGVAEVLQRPEFMEAVQEMLESESDEGSVVLADDAALFALYLRLENRIPDLRLKNYRRLAESDIAANQVRMNWNRASMLATGLSALYDFSLRSYPSPLTVFMGAVTARKTGRNAFDYYFRPPKLFDLAILGAGASVAYYLSSSGLDVDLNDTIIVGEKQPWEEQRGKLGVVNHPMNMIDPDYQGKTLLDEGLASREEFSKRIKAVIDKVASRREQTVDSVEQDGPDNAKYFKITAGKDVYFARRVVAGLGIGAQSAPSNITQAGKATSVEQLAENAKANQNDGYARIISMDTFQQAVTNGKLLPGTVNDLVIVGANAAIDVMTTALRKIPRTEHYDKITWIVSSGPTFLPGTDNELVERVYETARDAESTKRVRKEKLARLGVFSEIEVVPYSYVRSQVRDGGVTVVTGNRETKEEKQQVSGDIMVYGIGPDVAPVKKVFQKITFVPAYDLSLRFNTADFESKKGLEEVKDGINESLKGSIANNDERRAFVDKGVAIIGGITPLHRPTERISPKGTVLRRRSKEPLPRTLPAVIGFRAAKAGKDDLSSLEFIGGSAARFADTERQKVRYTYVSEAVGSLLTRTKSLSESLELYGSLTPDQQTKVKTFANSVDAFAQKAQAAAKAIEYAALTRPPVFEDRPEDSAVLKKKRAEFEKATAPFVLIDQLIEAARQSAAQSERDFAVADLGAAKYHHRLLLGLELELKGYFAQLEELREYAFNYGNVSAFEFMKPVAHSLPANVIGFEQLSGARSGAEVLRTYVPQEVAKEINLITSDATVIASHLTAGYRSIPPALVNYIAARIVFDRRHASRGKAPLPRPTNPNSIYSGFTLKQQIEFQANWMEKFKKLDKHFGAAAKKERHEEIVLTV